MFYNDDYDLAQDARDEAREAYIDGLRDDFDDEFADGDCSIDNPDCDWSEEEINPDETVFVCLAHDD